MAKRSNKAKFKSWLIVSGILRYSARAKIAISANLAELKESDTQISFKFKNKNDTAQVHNEAPFPTEHNDNFHPQTYSQVATKLAGQSMKEKTYIPYCL